MVMLALWHGSMPSAWEDEDPRALETALEIMAEALETRDGE